MVFPPQYLTLWAKAHHLERKEFFESHEIVLTLIAQGMKAMGKSNTCFKRFLSLVFLLSLLFAMACAEIRLGTISPPPPNARLRVFIQAFSGHRAYGQWIYSPEQFAKIHLRGMQNIFQKKGIYEVIGGEEVSTVLGKSWVSQGDWQRKDWDLVKKVGKALHAQYGMIIGRSIVQNTYLWEMVLINIETGKQFRIFSRLELKGGEDFKLSEFILAAYRELFNIANGDMLATAIRKGRRSADAATVPIPPSLDSEKQSIPSAVSLELDFKKVLQPKTRSEGRMQLAIYDLDAFEPYKIPALILSEALREEIFRLGSFTMVNREDIISVLEEMALQQTGLVSEKEAVHVGKVLAAHQIIKGRLGILGKTIVLQVKRIDVQTMGTLSLASLNCTPGKEEELLGHMPELARRLIAK